MTTQRYRSFTLVGIFLLAAAANISFAASPVEDSNQLFGNFDRDNNGSVSQAEIGGYNFLRYDQDGDGALTQAEFVGGRNADRRAALAGGATEASWKLLDWNDDGFLSGTELDGRWETFDADGDGRVYKKEFLGNTPNNPPLPPRTDFVPQPDNAPPPADDAKSLWGMKYSAARKSDFFTFFHLEALPDVVLLEAGTRHDFRPKGPAFRDAVLVQVLVDREQRIAGADVLVNRSFIDSPSTAPFARDLVKSVLRDFLPVADRAQVRSLINEVEFGDPNRVQINGAGQNGSGPPQLPNPPTAGYQAFLGKQDQFEQKLGTVKLVLWNGNEEGDDKLLRISIQVKTDDEDKT